LKKEKQKQERKFSTIACSLELKFRLLKYQEKTGEKLYRLTDRIIRNFLDKEDSGVEQG